PRRRGGRGLRAWTCPALPRSRSPPPDRPRPDPSRPPGTRADWRMSCPTSLVKGVYPLEDARKLSNLCAIIRGHERRAVGARGAGMAKLKRRTRGPVPPVQGGPDWIVVVLALLGLGVAGYLTALKLGGNQAFLCRDGSGCDIVQASRYSVLAGVPTAMWGAGVYL